MIWYFLYRLWLACKVTIPVNGKETKTIYKIWKYYNNNEFFYNNILLDVFPMYLYDIINIGWIKVLLLKVRYRNNIYWYRKFIRNLELLFLIKEFKLSKEDCRVLDDIIKDKIKQDRYISIIKKHYKRLHNDNYKDWKFIMNYTEIIDAIDEYLNSLSIDKAKEQIK